MIHVTFLYVQHKCRAGELRKPPPVAHGQRGVLRHSNTVALYEGFGGKMPVQSELSPLLITFFSLFATFLHFSRANAPMKVTKKCRCANAIFQTRWRETLRTRNGVHAVERTCVRRGTTPDTWLHSALICKQVRRFRKNVVFVQVNQGHRHLGPRRQSDYFQVLRRHLSHAQEHHSLLLFNCCFCYSSS